MFAELKCIIIIYIVRRKVLIFANVKVSRLIAIICIHIASLFLLSHAILPHCHHQGNESCVILSHNHCENKDCSDSHDTHKHNNACSGETNGCILMQMLPQHTFSSNEILPNILDSNIDLLYCTCLLELLKLDIPDEIIDLSFWEEKSYYLSYISPTLGLRAPPIV